MKYCPYCGTQNEDTASVCRECKKTLPDSGQTNQNQQQEYRQEYHYQQNYQQQNYQGYNGQPQYSGQPAGGQTGITSRNIALCVLFSIITCGIYSIYWMIMINDEVNALAGEPEATSGGMVFLFSLITCGIYGLYWLYKMGERCDRIKGNPYGNSGILFLILGIFGLSIISYCLIQDTINKSVQ